METPVAAPHVLAGVSSVLTLPCPSGGQEMVGKIPALVAAVWFFVMQESTGKETSGKEFAARCKAILGLFKGFREDDVVVGKVGDEEEGWKGWEVVVPKEVKSWVREITSNGWLELDWYTNINSGDAAANLEEDDDENPGNRTVVKKEGLGTTMQDRYDYLSQENRAEFAMWKETMLGTIDDLIKDGIMDTTDG